jgi:hypothetical protein
VSRFSLGLSSHGRSQNVATRSFFHDPFPHSFPQLSLRILTSSLAFFCHDHDNAYFHLPLRSSSLGHLVRAGSTSPRD